MELFDRLPEGVSNFFITYEYLALVLLFLISEAGIPLPFPNYLLVIFGSFLAFQGHGNLVLVLCFSVLGMIAGAWLLYQLARRGGHPLIMKYGKYVQLKPERVALVEGWFKKRGRIAVFLGRISPGVRIQTAAVAGLFRVPNHVFLSAAALSALLWTLLYILVGFLLKNGYDQVTNYLGGWYKAAAAIFILLLFVAILVIMRVRARRKEARSVPQ